MMSQTHSNDPLKVNLPGDGRKFSKEELTESLTLACDWLADVAQVKTDNLTIEKNKKGFKYSSWKGAIRGEYNHGRREWDFFCPVWHTGQAVKSLVKAYKLTKNEKYLQSAKLGADFITNAQIYDRNDPDFGLILAFEDKPDKVNTSAILECLDGLIHLAELENNDKLWERIISAGDFVAKKAYNPQLGLFRDLYDPKTHQFIPNPYPSKDNKDGRPLIDDAIFVRLYEKTGKKEYLDIHIRVSETLVEDQRPKGNWIDYGPCLASENRFHPRHTYWWGKPLIDTYKHTDRKEFWETALASGEFTLKAMRKDGGWIRGLFLENEEPLCFNTNSFGHATSGSACAGIFFIELYKETKDEKWLEGAEKAIEYCKLVQVKNATEDPNMQGVVIEKVLYPDGTDKSPYHIRDLGTIFFISLVYDYITL